MRKNYSLILFLFFSMGISAQDLDSLLQDENETQYIYETFKSTRVINGHSVERMTSGNLDFRIGHRFGTLNSGAYEFFGLDQSTVMLSLEYGVTDWMMVGLSRATTEKTVNGFVKFSLLRQSTGAISMPVSLSYYSSVDVYGLKWIPEESPGYFSSRLTYVHQLLVARKFNEKISFQLSPTFIHRNIVATAVDKNDLFSLGAGGRYKLTKRVTVNAEYFYVYHPAVTNITYNPNSLSFGFDIETGGHVFTILLTNSLGMLDKQFIGETTGRWKHGDLHLGFNISRVFGLKEKSWQTK